MMVLYCTKGHLVATTRQRAKASFDHQVIWARGGSGLPIGVEAPKFCYECGSETLYACTHCDTRIFLAANYCGGCGNPFPWTEIAISAANEYTDEATDLNEDEKAQLKGTFQDLTVRSPRTTLAAHRFVRLAKKAGPAAWDGLTEILAKVVVEGAKSAMGLQ